MRIKWTNEMLQKEAEKYSSRSEFERNSPAAYSAALRKGIVDKIFKRAMNG